jgi:hypothetical protein
MPISVSIVLPELSGQIASITASPKSILIVQLCPKLPPLSYISLPLNLSDMYFRLTCGPSGLNLVSTLPNWYEDVRRLTTTRPLSLAKQEFKSSVVTIELPLTSLQWARIMVPLMDQPLQDTNAPPAFAKGKMIARAETMEEYFMMKN